MATLRVAIIGGGPAGLAAAIELGRLSHIEWTLYEKKPVISEIGNGLSLQPNTWRMLELNGAAAHISATDVFRPVPQHDLQHRNAESGHLLTTHISPPETPAHQMPARAQRSVLQQALLREVDQSRVRVGKNVVALTQKGDQVELAFQDGSTDTVDLLIGADGIRSAARQAAFPGHKVAYTGSTAFRTVVRTSDGLRINGIPRAVTFWHGVGGKWIYTCPLGGNELEITARASDVEVPGQERVSWGHDVPVDVFLDKFHDVALPLRQLLSLVTHVGQYDFFAGPRLDTLIGHVSTVPATASSPPNIVLIGDASHPLSGAFGAGAAFALEDAHVLGGVLEWAHSTGHSVVQALDLFDRVRSPHYAQLYGVLDAFDEAEAKLKTQGPLPSSEEIAQRVASVWHKKYSWMYYYEADTVLKKAIADEKEAKARL